MNTFDNKFSLALFYFRAVDSQGDMHDQESTSSDGSEHYSGNDQVKPKYLDSI
jgi:hypothetical protein